MSVIEIAPGAVHLPGWLTLDQQRMLVEASRAWARPPAGMRATRMPNGSMMSVHTVCLGWHWVPYRYTETADDGAPVKPFPSWLGELGQQAVTAAFGDSAQSYEADTALVNFYDAGAKMGLHRDAEERSPAPVVSFSLGDSCQFRLGNTENRGRPWQDILLDSGDLFVFGGASRMAYHGVGKTLPGTGPAEIGLPVGRLNITLRESGLHHSADDSRHS